jgi:hypothetical protein
LRLLRPDHVPTMEGDPNDRPGYATCGRLYAIGYMRGLMEAVRDEGRRRSMRGTTPGTEGPSAIATTEGASA